MPPQIFVYRDDHGYAYSVGTSKKPQLASTGHRSSDADAPFGQRYIVNLRNVYNAYKGDIDVRSEVPKWVGGDAHQWEKNPRRMSDADFDELMRRLKGR